MKQESLCELGKSAEGVEQFNRGSNRSPDMLVRVEFRASKGEEELYVVKSFPRLFLIENMLFVFLLPSLLSSG